MLKKFFYIIVAFVSACLIFVLFFEIVAVKSSPKEQQPIVAAKAEKKEVVALNKKAIDDYLECLQKINEGGFAYLDCRYQENNLSEEKKDNNLKLSARKKPGFLERLQLVQAVKNTNNFIRMIYLIIFITLFLQIYFTLLSLTQKLPKRIFSVSEWAVNSPPILGVVGTIYSFASFTMNSDKAASLFTLFKANFYDAATTTIIGGSVYVINLALAIYINSALEEE